MELDEFRVAFERRQPPLAGTLAACPIAGGAQQSVRSLLIDLDKPAACFANRDGHCMRRLPAFTLRRGQVEFFDITAVTKRCYCAWTVELDYTVGGDKHTQRITDKNGNPFRTSASSRAKTYSYAGKRWYRGEHVRPPG